MKLKIKVIPRSSRHEVVGEMSDGTLKVKLTTPPVDGAANKELINVLHEHFHVPKTSITILKGHSSKNKLVEIKKHAD